MSTLCRMSGMALLLGVRFVEGDVRGPLGSAGRAHSESDKCVGISDGRRSRRRVSVAGARAPRSTGYLVNPPRDGYAWFRKHTPGAFPRNAVAPAVHGSFAVRWHP